MSAAVAEPPAAAQAEAVASEVAQPTPGGQQPISLQIGGIVAGLKAKQAEQKPTPPVTAEVKTETPKETPKEEVKTPEPTPTPEIKHNAGHFKVLEKDRDEWKQKFETGEAEWKKKFDALQAEYEPVKVSAAKLPDYEKSLADLRKQNEDYQAKIRQVDVTLDPQFDKEFTQPLQASMLEVRDLLVKGGVSKEDATAAVNVWDDNTFSDVTAGMNDFQKQRVAAAIQESERLNKVRQAQITKPEDYQAAQRQKQEQAQQQTIKYRQSVAEKIYSGALEATPALAEDAHAKFRDNMQAQLARAVKGEMPVEEVLQRVAGYEAMQLGLAGQHEELVAMKAQLDEKDKKIADLEAFVKTNGSVTLTSEAGGGANGEKYVPLAQRVVVRAG